MLSLNLYPILTLVITVWIFTLFYYLQKKGVKFGTLSIVALPFGIVIGLFFGGNLDYIVPIGKIYIRLLSAIVSPLIIFSILASVTSLSSFDKLKSIGGKSVFWLVLNTAIAIVITLFAGSLLGVGKNSGAILGSVDSERIAQISDRVTPFTDVLTNLFPENIINHLASNDVVPIIIFTVAIALALVILRNKQPERFKTFSELIIVTKEIIFTVAIFVVRLTPYAVFALTAAAAAKITSAVQTILPLLSFLGLTFALCAVHLFIVNGALIAIFAKLNPVKFFAKISTALLTAFTSQSSVGTLPVTIVSLVKRVGVSEEVANFTAPLGATIGMPACAGIWPVLHAVFAINALGLNYSVSQYITLCIISLAVSLGTAGVPGTATITSATVFSAAGLPTEIIVLLLPISSIADMARTATNVACAAVSSTIVAKKNGELDVTIFNSKGVEIEYEKVYSHSCGLDNNSSSVDYGAEFRDSCNI